MWFFAWRLGILEFHLVAILGDKKDFSFEEGLIQRYWRSLRDIMVVVCVCDEHYEFPMQGYDEMRT